MNAITGDRAARAALTRLFEPADRVVAAIVGQLGAYAAFRLLTGEQAPHVLKGVTPEELTAAVACAAQRYAGANDPQKDLDDAAAMGGGFLIPGDEHWPAGIDDLEVPPLGLWYRGNLTTGIPTTDRCVTLTGSRDCTSYGAAVAGDFAHGLAQRGITVVSGLAYGVDAVSHRAALAGGTPDAMPTLAVVAGGVDRFYPSGNADLGRAILPTGVILSETPAGTAPTRYRFIQRGRIMAALSGVVCIVEARYRSGALSIAHHGETIARHVAVVPGPVTSANSAGCHRLARDGSAILVTETNDLMELLTAGGPPQKWLAMCLVTSGGPPITHHPPGPPIPRPTNTPCSDDAAPTDFPLLRKTGMAGTLREAGHSCVEGVSSSNQAGCVGAGTFAAVSTPGRRRAGQVPLQ